MSLEARLDTLHARARRNLWLQRFTTMTRLLLAAGFIPPGLTKVLGHPFTRLGVDHPVGYFFDAFFQAGGFYAFVGAMQVLAAVLLLFRRTATLGAVLYFPLIVTIFVVTVSIGFQGTWAITGLMALACLYLLCWDYDRLKPLLPFRPVERAEPGHLALVVSAMAGGGAALGGIVGALGIVEADVFAAAGVLLLIAFASGFVAWVRRRGMRPAEVAG